MTIYDAGPLAAGPLCGLLKLILKNNKTAGNNFDSNGLAPDLHVKTEVEGSNQTSLSKIAMVLPHCLDASPGQIFVI